MATEEILQTLTHPAGGDLSAAQYKWVSAPANSTERVSIVTSAGDGYGILQDKPAAAGRAACIAIGGRSKVWLGGTVDSGDEVTTDSSGRAVAVSSGEDALGVIIEGGTSGKIGSMLIRHRATIG